MHIEDMSFENTVSIGLENIELIADMIQIYLK